MPAGKLSGSTNTMPPASNASNATNSTASTQNARPNGSPNNAAPKDEFPPPKTDKPRPHVCQVCKRPFARLEHLKRHERSHTKEKPFKCGECQRCFARRDLLLRHQQKLHNETAPPARPRNGRRDSHSGVVNGPKVRKNSIAGGSVSGRAVINQGTPGAGMRPRANTISHVDNQTLTMLQNGVGNSSRNMNTLSSIPQASALNMHNLQGPSQYAFRGMSTTHGNLPDLRLDTQAALAAGLDLTGGLHTAPLLGMSDIGMGEVYFGPGNTINPAQLHYMDSPTAMTGTPTSPFPSNFGSMHANSRFMDEEDNFSYLWSNPHAAHHRSQSLGAGIHPASEIDFSYGGSSPSVISSTGHDSLISDVLLDASSNSTNLSLNATTSSPSMWNGQQAMMTPPLSGSSMPRHQPQQSLPSSLAAVSLTSGTLVPSPPSAAAATMFNSLDSPTPSSLSLSYSGQQQLHQSFIMDSSPASTPGGNTYMAQRSPDIHFGMPPLNEKAGVKHDDSQGTGGIEMWSQETMQPMFQGKREDNGLDMWS